MGAIRGRAPRCLARAEQIAYLFMPLWQAIVGGAPAAAVLLAVLDVASFWDTGPWWQLVFFYVLGFGGVLLGCAARGAPQGAPGVARGLAVAHLYAVYSWLLWPVLLRSAARQLTERRDWAKTEREPVG